MRILRLLKSLLRNTRGVTTVEFALLLPVLIVLIMGMVEMTNYVIAQRKILAASQTVADLISQETDVTSASLDDLISAGKMVIRPMASGPLAVGVASVRWNSDAVASIDWTHSLNSGVVDNALALAAPLAEANTSVIIVIASYTYTPLTGSLIMGNTTVSSTSFNRPRLVEYIEKS